MLPGASAKVAEHKGMSVARVAGLGSSRPFLGVETALELFSLVLFLPLRIVYAEKYIQTMYSVVSLNVSVKGSGMSRCSMTYCGCGLC